MFERLKSDTAAATRSFRRTPSLVAGAIFTLAVSVGLNVAVFGLIHRALLSPPSHVVDPERVFTLRFGAPDDDGPASMASTSYVAFKAISEGVPAIKSAAAYQRTAATFMQDGDQRNVNAMLVSGSYFALLGARPVLGRVIGPGDDEPGAAAPAAVLGHTFWRTVLQEDSTVLGRRVTIGGMAYTVAGVMPRGFGGHATTSVDVWVPFAVAMRATPGWDRERFRNVAGVVVRLAPGETPAAAATQSGVAIERPVALKTIAGSEVAATERTVAKWLLGVAILVLVIGLANSALLLVVRGVRARPVMAIRAALGASHMRLRAQVMLEATFLAVIATLLSLVLASSMDEALRRVLFPGLIGADQASPAALLTASLAGLAAALIAGGASLSQISMASTAIHPSAGQSGTNRRSRTMTSLLLVQTTLAVVLLSGAGLLGSSLVRLRGQDFGMTLDRVVVVDFEQTSADLDGQDQFFTEAVGRIKALPGIELVTTIDAIPFAGFNVPPISVPGRAEPPAAGQQLPFLTAATPEYLEILGIQILEGRPFQEADDRGAPVVLVNQTMARGVWPGESAVGKCIRIGFDKDFDPSTFDPSSGPPMPSSALPCREVVGVTRDVRQRSVLPADGEDRLMQYYVPFSQVPAPPFAPNPTRIRGLIMKANTRTENMAAAIRRSVLAGRSDLPYLRVRPYSQLLDRQMRPWDTGTRLFGLFSALALVTAATGMFAAFAHAVAERRREMAIRLAIGARPAALRTMVLREALVVAFWGAAMGAISAAVAGKAMGSLLFGTAPTDPLVLAASSALMLLIAAAATVIPARDAARANPAVLLRAE